MALDLIMHLVALSHAQRMCQSHVAELGRPVGFVDTSYPGVAPPVGKHMRIIEAEDVDVGAMNEVVRENASVAAAVVRTDHPDARRHVPAEM